MALASKRVQRLSGQDRWVKLARRIRRGLDVKIGCANSDCAGDP
jgi:hypothetical protein